MVQFLPPDDLFAAGSPAYGGVGTGFLPLYLGAKFAHTVAVTNVWQPSGQLFIARPMHGGYQTTNPATGVSDYNAAFHNSGTGTVAHAGSRAPSGMMFRQEFAADVVVQGIFEMRSLLGQLALSDVAPRGVFARAQAGTLSGDGTADPEVRDGSCYFAVMYQRSNDSSMRFAIMKFVAGALTVILESAALPTATSDFSKLLTITLSVVGTGLFATVFGFGSSAALRLPSSGTVTDASLAGAGRCGFIMGADREPVAGRRQVDLCHMLRVEEGGVLKLQDEFQRLSLAAAKQTTADLVGTVGNYVSSAYYWDAGTFDGSFSAGGKTYTGARKLRRNVTAARVEFDHTTTDDDVNAGRFLLSQRPADSRLSQHRSIKVIIPTAPDIFTTGEVWAGIVLRASQAQPLDELVPTNSIGGAGPNFSGNGTAGTGGTGYMFVVRARTASSVTWFLRKVVNNAYGADGALLAEFTIFPGYGVQFTMEMEVYPRNAADQFGPVEIVCKVNGSLLAMVPAGALQNPSTGVFVDATGTRIKSGRGEGLVCANGYLRGGTASASIDPVFEAWTQLALTNAVVLDEDQASVSVLTEGAASGTALNTILVPSELPIVHQTWKIDNPFESGHRQTVPRFRTQATDALFRRQRMRFRKTGTRRAELEALLAHLHAQRGVEVPFNYTPPGGVQTKVHYVSDRIEYRMTGAGSWDVEFELERLV